MMDYIDNFGKRLILLLSSLLMGMSLFAYTFSGTTGGVQYSLDTESGTLHIYGSGAMGDYNGNWGYGYSGTAPWLNENAAGECLRTNIWGNCAQYQRYNLRTTIKSVVIEDGVTSIGAAAFYNCPNLERVEIPNSVTLINYEAFRGCTKLEEVNVPASVTQIRDRWATDCDNMKNVNVDPDNAYYASVNGILYTRDMKTIVKMPDNNLVTDYSIPEGVTQMATDAIYKQRNVVNVVLPTTMTSIRYGVFDNCANLTSFTLRNCTPPSLEKNITGSSKLKTVNVPCGCETNFRTVPYWSNLANGVIQPKNVVVVNVRSNDPALGSVEVKMPSCSDRTVHLVANATELGEFDYWSDEPNNHNFYRTFQANQDATYDIIAYFKPRKFQLQLVRCSPAADYVFSLKGDGQYAYGSNPKIECVINEAGWVFDSWRECNDQNKVVSTQNPLTVDIKGYTCYCARIKRGKSLLTVQSANTTMGTVSPNIKNEQYDYGTSMEISATPNEEYVFTQWSDGSTEMTRSITVTSDAVYTAYFKKKTYKITAVPNDAELGSCTGYGTFDKNATVTLSATPIGCSRFVKWTDGEQDYTENPYVFRVKEAKDFVAVFESANKETEERVTACESYTWNGTEYTESGDYTTTLPAANGCDSVVTLHLTIHHAVTNEISETACDSYTWNGTEYTESGVYTKSLPAANGCDSVVTLHLTIHHPVTNEISETACETYTWNGTEYTESGDYTKSLPAANGCDSVVTLHLTIHHPVTNEISETACESYTWNGTEYTESGDYTKSLPAANGCDSVVTLHLTIHHPVTNEISETACESYTWNGTEYTETGVYTKSLPAANGCDSVVTLHLTIQHAVTNEISETACDSYTWNGTEYTESGDYTKSLTAANGCDSVVTLHLTIHHPVTNEISETACGIYVWDGTDYTVSGDYKKNYVAANGCDSIVTLHLTILNTMTVEVDEAACESYTWNGTEYTASGDYTNHFTTEQGCDSIVILHLTINHAETSEFSETACESYTWDGTVYTVSGDYTKPFVNKAGCDSVVTLHLTINEDPKGVRYDTLVVCGKNSYKFMDVNYSKGKHDITYRQSNGEGECDSVINLHLYVVPPISKPDNDTVVKSVCMGERITLGFSTSGLLTESLWYVQGELQTESPWDGAARVRVDYPGYDNYEYMLVRTTPEGYCADTTVYIYNSTHNIESGVLNPMVLYAGEDCKATVRLRDYMPAFKDLCSMEITDTICIYNINGAGDLYASATDSFTFVDGDSIFWRVGIRGADGFEYTVSTPAFHQRVTVVDTIAPEIDALGISYQNRSKEVSDSVGGDVVLTIPMTDVTDHVSDNCDAVENLAVQYSYDGVSYSDFAGLDLVMNVYTEPTKTVYYTITDKSGNTTVDSVLYRIERKSLVGEDSFAVVRDTMVCPSEMPYTWHGAKFNAGGLSQVVGAAHLTLHVAEGYEKTDTVIVCESFVWRDGIEYTNSTKDPVFVVNNGPGECDSLIHLNLTVLNPSSGSDSIVICVKELPYNWNGFNIEGDSTVTLRNIYGCDSLVDVKVVILPVATETIYDTACVSYTLNDSVYTKSGTYEQTLTSQVTGCDSILTLHLVINDVKKQSLHRTVCGSYTLNDSVYTETGVYTQTLVSKETGCDSILTLHLTVNPISQTKDTVYACEGDLPILWHNRLLKGDSTITLMNKLGCDSIVEVKVITRPVVVTEITDTACGFYVLNDFVYNHSSDYMQRLTSKDGCDSIVKLHLTILEELPLTILYDTVCNSYTLNDSVYTESGVYEQTLSAAAGCDSTIRLYLTVLPSVEYTFKDSVRGAYDWNGTIYTESGKYQQSFTTERGCDSTVTLDLKIIEAPKVIVSDTACSDGLVWNGVLIKESGIYPKVDRTIFGDDSTTILHLTVLPEIVVTLYDTAATAYTLNDSVYTESGIYKQVLKASNGCDSMVILNLKIKDTSYEYLTEVACGSFTLNDSVYTTSGRYQQNFKRADGGDSVLVLDLTVWPTYRDTIADTVCGSYTWMGETYTESGIYQQTYLSTRGCDSIVTLDLTVLNVPVTQFADTACGSYVFNDSVYTKSGSYVHRFSSYNGCDSLVKLDLVILKQPITVINDTVCLSYKLNDSVYTQSGVYDQYFQAKNGCDSIVRLNLVVMNTPTGVVYDTVCGSYTLNGEVLTGSTSFEQRVDSPTGCDSIITVHLTILPVKYDTLHVTSCGDYFINDTTYTQSGKYQQKLTSSMGCDSILTIYLDILEPTHGKDTVTLCENMGYLLWHDYKVSSDTVLTIKNHMGCDSIVDVKVVRLPILRSEVHDTACAPYYWHGREYLVSGDFNYDTISSLGCDSVETLHLYILPSYEIFLQDSAVSYYDWNDVRYDSTGLYTQRFTSSLGCDSVVTMMITILDPPADAPVKVKSCISYQWYGKTLTESGIYYEILKNVAGEDSIVGIDLTINQPKVNPDTIHYTVCENELPVIWNGYEMTKEFSRVILQTVEGCDSFINFRLHILPTYDTLEYETACDSFVWHGKTYTKSGTYHDTLQSIYGCDSTFTLSLYLKHSSVTEIYRNVCESELPIRWNEYEFYHDTIIKFPCSNGCDSIIKVELTVNKEYNLVYDEVACGDFYWQGELLTISGTYVDSFTTQAGCDSIVTLNLIVTHPYRVDLVDTTIAGSIYEKNGFTVDAQTVGQYEYEVMLKSVYGCDSLVHLSLYVDGRDINITWTNVSGGTMDYLNGKRWERKFCSSDEYFANYVIRTGVPDSFKISFDHEGVAQGFKNVSGHLESSDTVGSISFVVPDGVDPGTYNVFVQLFGEGKASQLVALKINVGLDYKRVTRMWNDVVVFDNSDHRYVSYQWKKNDVDIPGATGQYYCDYDGLNGFYSLDVVTTTNDTLYVCGRYFEPLDVTFSISTYPVYTNTGKVTVYAKGVTEEELKAARMYVYTLDGELAYWTNIVHKETEVRVREGRYVCIVILEDQRSASCRFVSHAVELSR